MWYTHPRVDLNFLYEISRPRVLKWNFEASVFKWNFEASVFKWNFEASVFKLNLKPRKSCSNDRVCKFCSFVIIGLVVDASGCSCVYAWLYVLMYCLVLPCILVLVFSSCDSHRLSSCWNRHVVSFACAGGLHMSLLLRLILVNAVRLVRFTRLVAYVVDPRVGLSRCAFCMCWGLHMCHMSLLPWMLSDLCECFCL